jgi:urease accessory protein
MSVGDTLIGTETVTATSVIVGAGGWTRLHHGLLRAQQSLRPGGWVRIGLLATTALLLGGDAVDLRITVGEGARLDLYDVAGTVAYDGRGRPSAWHTRITVAAGGCLVWSGAPFVVADGAEVSRTLELEADGAATVAVRETLVLGRSGELGGRLRNRTSITVAGRPALLEDQLLDPTGLRRLPGMLGDRRVIDSIITLGPPNDRPIPGASAFRMVDDRGRVHRFLGSGLAESPIHSAWRERRLPLTTP